jgi:hypothetical protein
VQGVAATASTPFVEALNGLASTFADPIEAAGGIASTTTDILEALQGIAATGTDPVDAQGNTPGHGDHGGGHRGARRRHGTVSEHPRGRPGARDDEAVAGRVARRRAHHVGVPDRGRAGDRRRRVGRPVETVAAVAITRQLPVEALQLVRQAVSVPLESVAATPSGADRPGVGELCPRARSRP